MSWYDDLESRLEEYGKYIDSEGKIRDLFEAGISGGALGVADLVRKNYQEEGIPGAVSTFTGLGAIPKRALIDIPVHEASSALVGEQGAIRPAEDIAIDALIPDERSGDVPSIDPTIGIAEAIRGKSTPNPELDDISRHVGRGILKPVLGAATDPLLPALGLSKTGGAIAGAAFVPEMAKSGGEELGTALALGEDQGDIGAALEHGISGAASLGMAGLGGLHTGKRIASEVAPLVPDIMNKPVVWEASKPVTPPPETPTGSVVEERRLTPEENRRLDRDPLFNDTAFEQFRAKELQSQGDPLEAYVLRRQLAGENISSPEVLRKIAAAEDIRGRGSNILEEDLSQPTGGNDYLEVKPLITEKLPAAIDTTAKALGWTPDPFEGTRSKMVDEYKGPYSDIEADLENTLGPETGSVVESTPTTPKELPHTPRNLPTIPKTGGEDIRAAIDRRAREIKDQVVGIDPVRARKLAMLDIAREQSIKAKETFPEPSKTLFGIEKKNIGRTVTTIEGNKVGTVVDMFGGGPNDKAGHGPKIPSYKIKFEDGSEQIINARGLRFTPKEVPEISKVEGTSPEVRALIEKNEVPKAETPEVSEVLPTKRYHITMEDGSTHVLKGTDEAKVRAYAEKNWGTLSEVRELAKFERASSGGKKPPIEPPKEPNGGDGSEPPKPLKSEVDPNESSLFDDITDLPKTLKSSWDISFPLRQGYFLLNRAEALKGMAKGTKSGLAEKYHLETQEDLSKRSNAELYDKFGLNQIKYDPTEPGSLSEQHPLMKQNPSAFSKAVQKIPGLKQSERMFTDSGNLVRANMFDALTEKWMKTGKTPETRPDLYYGTAKYLNVLTGRDPLPNKLRQAGYILNKIFWSPQYVKSRMQLLNPGFYYKLPREVQLEAIRDVGGTLATTAALISVAGYAAQQSGNKDEVKVEWNPTHSDFGKLRVGKTKYDFFTGLSPIVRTASRIATSRKETPNGEYKIPGGFGLMNNQFDTPTEYLPVAPFGQSAFGEVGKFVEGKTAPGYQIGKGLLTGKDYYGGKYELPDFLSDIGEPMSAGDILYAWKNYDAMEGLKALPSLLGVGVQVDRIKEPDSAGGYYSNKKRKKKKSSTLY